MDKIGSNEANIPKQERPHGGFTNKYQHWVRNYGSFLTSRKQVEPFKGKIRVPSKITQELPNIEGIEWVYESKIPTLDDKKK